MSFTCAFCAHHAPDSLAIMDHVRLVHPERHTRYAVLEWDDGRVVYDERGEPVIV
jgi:hypothetical protein